MKTAEVSTGETEAPVALQIVKRPPFWIEDGQWYGEGVVQYPVGRCTCCGWQAPLQRTGTNASCLLCYPANKKQAQSGAVVVECEMFCEDPVPLPVPVRADPGGAICCAACQGKVKASLSL